MAAVGRGHAAVGEGLAAIVRRAWREWDLTPGDVGGLVVASRGVWTVAERRRAEHRLRGLARLGREEYAFAAATLGLAFGASPDEDAALAFVLGWARIGADDRTGAVTAFRNAIRIEPSMTAAYLALAETYVGLGHPALARQALEAGLGALPESSELRRMLTALKK